MGYYSKLILALEREVEHMLRRAAPPSSALRVRAELNHVVHRLRFIRIRLHLALHDDFARRFDERSDTRRGEGFRRGPRRGSELRSDARKQTKNM